MHFSSFDSNAGDEIVCEHYDDTLGGFLTVRATSNCHLTYQHDRLGKQFGQFWIMDRVQNRILTRSLISVQIQVLKDIACDQEPELFIRQGQNSNDRTKTNVNQPVHLTVILQPHCLLVQPREQTITELTAMCSNSPPVVLANGGIEVKYQCKPVLCEKYYVCFIGEFSLKLPSTKTKCFITETEGSGNGVRNIEEYRRISPFLENECKDAANEYGRLKPRNRSFSIEEPVTPVPMVAIPSQPVANPIVVEPSRLKSTTTTTTAVKPKEESMETPWMFIVLAGLTLLGLAAFVGWKFGLVTWIQQLTRGNQFRPSSSSANRYTVERSTLSTNFDENLFLPQSVEPPPDDPHTPRRINMRSQHVKLGPLDEDEI